MNTRAVSLHRYAAVAVCLGAAHCAAAPGVRAAPASSMVAPAPAARSARAESHEEGRAMGMTPLAEQGVEVLFEELPQGAAIRLTATPHPTPRRVQSLRERVHGWVERRKRNASTGAATEAGECADGGPPVPTAVVTDEEVDGGARLVYRATGGTATELRANVKRYAERLRSGACHMIGQP